MDCPDACSLVVDRNPNGNIQIRGNPEHPFTQGFTCAKIKRHIDRLGHPERILKPMLRRQKGWQAISWDQALGLCVGHIQALRETPSAILHVPGEGAKGVLKKGVGLFFARLGSSRVKGSLCDAAGFVAYLKDFCSRENPRPENLLHAGRIINWGKDLSRSSVHMAALVQKARQKGARVLTISPEGDGNRPLSDAIIRIRPGTDRFLAAAIIRQFMEREKVLPSVIHATRDWDKFQNMIFAWPAEQLIARCGVSQDNMETVFRWYAGDQPSATLVGAGLQRYRYGGENVRFINALAMVSGHLTRKGGGSYFHLHTFGNVNLDWTRSPGHSPRRTFILPRIGQEILDAKDPPVGMVWINGSNIINQAPNILQTIRALAAVPFKVVVDAFMTDTAQQADLVLPSTLMLEQTDLLGSYLHPYVQLVQAVLPPPGEARDDYWIVSELGKSLDPPILMPSMKEAFRMSLENPHLETNLEELQNHGSIQAGCPEVPYKGLKFAHSDGLYHPPTMLHDEPLPPAGYPRRLLSLIRRHAIHAQIPPQEQQMPPMVWVSPATRRQYVSDPKPTAWLISPLGRMTVRVRTMEGLQDGVVVYRRGDWMKLGGGINRLIQDGVTDLGNGAPFYDQYVRLESNKEE